MHGRFHGQALERVLLGCPEIHKIELLFSDLVEYQPTNPVEKREWDFFGSQQQKVDIPAFEGVVGPGTEQIHFRLRDACLHMLFNGGLGFGGNSHGVEW